MIMPEKLLIRAVLELLIVTVPGRASLAVLHMPATAIE